MLRDCYQVHLKLVAGEDMPANSKKAMMLMYKRPDFAMPIRERAASRWQVTTDMDYAFARTCSGLFSILLFQRCVMLSICSLDVGISHVLALAVTLRIRRMSLGSRKNRWSLHRRSNWGHHAEAI